MPSGTGDPSPNSITLDRRSSLMLGAGLSRLRSHHHCEGQTCRPGTARYAICGTTISRAREWDEMEPHAVPSHPIPLKPLTGQAFGTHEERDLTGVLPK
jgi:hypothetical protein